MKRFNSTGLCVPSKHYMVNLDGKLAQIRKFVDDGCYFMINRARQYGKTTTLAALAKVLKEDYLVISLDFQALGNESFKDENRFSVAFAKIFLQRMQQCPLESRELENILFRFTDIIAQKDVDFDLKELFDHLTAICAASPKPLVLMIDEVDSATNNQVFLDFLAQLRYYYIKREANDEPAFHSVILAGVYDIKNMKRKIRPDMEHKMNSPWNIAINFDIDMSFHKDEIAGMLAEYEKDRNTGMNVDEMAGLLYDYTSGYPFLVSRLCQLIDELVAGSEGFPDKSSAWCKDGFLKAVSMLLIEPNTLFDSLFNKLEDYPELDRMLRRLLFEGKEIFYTLGNRPIELALMFGFVKKSDNLIVVSNRILETLLYNLYLVSPEAQQEMMQNEALRDKNQFIQNGHLDMKRVLERFVVHFHDLYGDRDEKFLEEDGRRYFLLYLRPIINGTGNYYVEAQTRDMERTDVVVDYNGEQFVIELKIWRGEAYHTRGEVQLSEYLDYYQLDKGYMLSFCFNKKKHVGVKEIRLGKKVLVEAVV